MKNEKLILTLSWIIVIVTLLLLIVTLNKFGVITGQATDTAAANLTINESASVAFTDDVCDFGSGQVIEDPENPDQAALVYSDGTATVNGTWGTSACDGLAIKNDGNVNVSVALSADGYASSLIGGTGSMLNMTAVPSACAGTSDTNESYTSWTASATICSNWAKAATADIDFILLIPEDADPATNGIVITATATA